MLKEVGASGQISLGKKYAGQLFDMVFYPDGRVELVPMKAVPAVQSDTTASTPASAQEQAGSYRVGDGWLTPERLAARKAARERSPQEAERLARQWESENQHVIDERPTRHRKSPPTTVARRKPGQGHVRQIGGDD